VKKLKEAYKTVYEDAEGEITVKKSKFIAVIHPAETEEAAEEFINARKKKYWDASHNCSAYIIGTENPLLRCSDDGEPSKTAGRPMLDILIAQELTNLVVVVTRYFGGTLLGTGGLVKAYQSAVLEGLSHGKIITKQLADQILITTDYNQIGKIQYFIGQDFIPILSSEYTDTVKLNLLVPAEKKQSFLNKITELTNGSAVLEEIKQVYFAIINTEVYLFE
jgi:uncharacterized YigZ family protein